MVIFSALGDSEYAAAGGRGERQEFSASLRTRSTRGGRTASSRRFHFRPGRAAVCGGLGGRRGLMTYGECRGGRTPTERRANPLAWLLRVSGNCRAQRACRPGSAGRLGADPRDPAGQDPGVATVGPRRHNVRGDAGSQPAPLWCGTLMETKTADSPTPTVRAEAIHAEFP